jgi:hypothetical protein
MAIGAYDAHEEGGVVDAERLESVRCRVSFPNQEELITSNFRGAETASVSCTVRSRLKECARAGRTGVPHGMVGG